MYRVRPVGLLGPKLCPFLSTVYFGEFVKRGSIITYY